MKLKRNLKAMDGILTDKVKKSAGEEHNIFMFLSRFYSLAFTDLAK